MARWHALRPRGDAVDVTPPPLIVAQDMLTTPMNSAFHLGEAIVAVYAILTRSLQQASEAQQTLKEGEDCKFAAYIWERYGMKAQLALPSHCDEDAGAFYPLHILGTDARSYFPPKFAARHEADIAAAQAECHDYLTALFTVASGRSPATPVGRVRASELLDKGDILFERLDKLAYQASFWCNEHRVHYSDEYIFLAEALADFCAAMKPLQAQLSHSLGIYSAPSSEVER